MCDTQPIEVKLQIYLLIYMGVKFGLSH